MGGDTRKQRKMLNEDDDASDGDSRPTLFDNDDKDEEGEYEDKLANKRKPSYEFEEAVVYRAELPMDDDDNVRDLEFGFGFVRGMGCEERGKMGEGLGDRISRLAGVRFGDLLILNYGYRVGFWSGLGWEY